MPYVPLNRIKTGLYTSGEEYIRVDTGEYYAGVYYELYDGTKFTGESPNDNTSIELISQEASDYTTSEAVLEVSPILPLGNFDADPTIVEPVIPQNVNNYRISKLQNPGDTYKLKLPEPFIPKPTPEDYTVTEFRRYFVKKQNEYSFTEINQQTFEKLVTRNSQYYWQAFNPAQIPWKISGKRSEVERVNRNMVKLAEQRFKVPGLSKYLQEDYLKYYRES